MEACPPHLIGFESELVLKENPGAITYLALTYSSLGLDVEIDVEVCDTD